MLLIRSVYSFCKFNRVSHELLVRRYASTSKMIDYKANFRIIGTNSPHTSMSVVLNCCNKRILFNAGEGFTRLAQTQGIARSSINCLFLTRLDWRSIGAIPTIYIDSSIISNIKRKIVGPQNTNEIIKTFKNRMNFAHRDVKFLEVVECDEETFIKENNFNTHCIPLRGNCKGSGHILAYVINIEQTKSKLDVQKIVDLDVPLDRIKELMKGLDVQLEDGRTIKPSDVSLPIWPALKFLVLDIPSKQDVALLDDPNLLKEVDGMTAVMHLSPIEAIQTSRYQHFLTNFPKGTTHLMQTSDISSSGLVSAHRFQRRLNEVDSRIFPLLKEDIDPPNAACENESVRPVKTFQIEMFQPERESIDKLSEMISIDYGRDIYVDSTKYKDFIEDSRKRDNEEIYPKIVFLGTSASMCTRRRNVAGILVHINKKKSILMDCGDGTLGQIYRLYGDKTNDVLSRIKAIYVSHLHIDHFGGVYNVLRQLNQLCGYKNVPILGPNTLNEWLDGVTKQMLNDKISYEFFKTSVLMRDEEEQKFICRLCDLSSVKLCFVNHITNACAISIETKSSDGENFKLTYSGDCKPTPFMHEIGKDSTILIHDATFDDKLVEMAQAKSHSTIEQAIDEGIKMNAKYTILTHFSKRYAIPLLHKPLPPNVSIAFDNMELTEKDLPWAHHFLDIIKPHFDYYLSIKSDEVDESEEFEEIEEKN